MSQVDRASLLRRLLAAGAGLAPAGSGSLLGSCFFLSKGWVYAFNQEIACAAPAAGLDPSARGAVPAEEFIKILRNTEEEFVDISATDKSLIIKGKGKRTQLPLDADAKMDASRVERPGEYTRLDPTFAEGISRVVPCCRKKVDPKEFGKSCVHITPTFVEACDNVRAARYDVATFVAESALVRGTTVAELVPLGFTQACETPRWLHFRNPSGLRMSLRKIPGEDYPDYGELLSKRGSKVTLPRGLKGAALRAGVVAEADEEGEKVIVRLTREGTFVEGSGALGRHVDEREAAEFEGEGFAFKVPAKLLAELSEKRGELEVCGNALRLSDGPYTYLTSLEPVT